MAKIALVNSYTSAWRKNGEETRKARDFSRYRDTRARDEMRSCRGGEADRDESGTVKICKTPSSSCDLPCETSREVLAVVGIACELGVIGGSRRRDVRAGGFLERVVKIWGLEKNCSKKFVIVDCDYSFFRLTENYIIISINI